MFGHHRRSPHGYQGPEDSKGETSSIEGTRCEESSVQLTGADRETLGRTGLTKDLRLTELQSFAEPVVGRQGLYEVGEQ